MLIYMRNRAISSIIVLLGVSIIVFLLIHLAPGNPARLMLSEGASDAEVAEMEKKLGIDKPLPVQYVNYMSDVLRGDLGESLYYKEPNAKIIMEYLPATAMLTFAAVFLSILISLPMGILAGVKKGSIFDFFAMFFALLGQAMSPVWLGIVLIFILAVNLNLLPSFGYGEFKNIIMPAITLGIPMAALITRLTRAGMIDTLQEDFIVSIRAKGIPERKIISRYALKNALIPIITIVGLNIGTFLGGAVVTEKIFGWPGIGMLAVTAIYQRDFPLVQSIMLIVSAIFVFVNILVDIIYTTVDPRLSFESKR